MSIKNKEKRRLKRAKHSKKRSGFIDRSYAKSLERFNFLIKLIKSAEPNDTLRYSSRSAIKNMTWEHQMELSLTAHNRGVKMIYVPQDHPSWLISDKDMIIDPKDRNLCGYDLTFGPEHGFLNGKKLSCVWR